MKIKVGMMNKAYKFRLYPTKAQQTLFAKTFGCVRFVYNRMLADKIAYYRETGKNLTVTPARYKEEFPWLKEVDSLALANAQLHLQSAYKNFFREKKVGFPKFKSKKDNRASYSTNNQKGSVRIEAGKIRLPKIGFVKLIQHRPLMANSEIKTVTVERTPTGKYFVSVLVEYENQVLPVEPKEFVGLDFSMHELYVSSTGYHLDYPRFFRRSERRLAKAQRQLSRKQVGSKNRAKARLRISRIHEKTANRRKDFLHKQSYRLACQYDAVCIEDLDMKAMSKTLNFGKSVSDNGWGMFRNMLSYKLTDRGKELVLVDKWYPSSQLCHACGYKNSETKNLDIREWTCPECGTRHDRDINAAINIREEGKRNVFAQNNTTVGHTESYACGENVRHQNPSGVEALFSSKQEAPASNALGR